MRNIVTFSRVAKQVYISLHFAEKTAFTATFGCIANVSTFKAVCIAFNG
ncbi:MAG: hypothetical protein ACLS6I_02945 [Ruminococcus sp.]|nr:hypothetical protein [Ruminococcus bromii]